jgi:hypothetical protein
MLKIFVTMIFFILCVYAKKLIPVKMSSSFDLLTDTVSSTQARALPSLINPPRELNNINWKVVYDEWFELSKDFFVKIKKENLFSQYKNLYNTKKDKIFSLRNEFSKNNQLELLGLKLDEVEKNYQNELHQLIGFHYSSFLKLQHLYEEETKLDALDF